MSSYEVAIARMCQRQAPAAAGETAGGAHVAARLFATGLVLEPLEIPKLLAG